MLVILAPLASLAAYVRWLRRLCALCALRALHAYGLLVYAGSAGMPVIFLYMADYLIGDKMRD